jgi:hypothetical protein
MDDGAAAGASKPRRARACAGPFSPDHGNDGCMGCGRQASDGAATNRRRRFHGARALGLEYRAVGATVYLLPNEPARSVWCRLCRRGFLPDLHRARKPAFMSCGADNGVGRDGCTRTDRDQGRSRRLRSEASFRGTVRFISPRTQPRPAHACPGRPLSTTTAPARLTHGRGPY